MKKPGDSVPEIINWYDEGACTSTEVTNGSILTDDVIDDADTLTNPSNEGFLRRAAGRPRGTTQQAKLELAIRKSSALTKAAIHLAEERNKAVRKGRNVCNGVFKKIIEETEADFELAPGSLKLKTIEARVGRNNLTGIAHQRTSPLSTIEPIIVEYCLRLANMGAPLSGDQVICLADSLISGTKIQESLIEFKKKRNLIKRSASGTSSGSSNSGESVIGTAWYKGFMKRNACKVKSKRGHVKDIKRHTWCCFEAFESMYQHVYEKMVEAKVAVKLDNPVMYDRDGIEVTEKEKSFGLPSFFKVTDPRNILFVDETGKNTNMKTDGGVGGRRLIVPADAIGNNSGYLGSTSDIHFTVLCFTCATGEAVMCAVIFKSKKKYVSCQLHGSLVLIFDVMYLLVRTKVIQ